VNGPQPGRRQQPAVVCAVGWGLAVGPGGVLEGDAVAEGLELGDEAASLALGVLAAGEAVVEHSCCRRVQCNLRLLDTTSGSRPFKDPG
jgi:hypothetical protein